MAVTGQWNLFGQALPDFGISEKLGLGSPNPLVSAQNQGTTSGLVGFNGQAMQTPTLGGGGVNLNVQGLSTTPPAGGGGGQPSGGQVLGGQTSGFNSGGASDAAKSQAQIELEQALNEYDYQRQGLEAQSGQLDQQRLSALGTLDTEQGRAQKEADTAKTEATNATRSAQGKALSTAQDIQKKNRNVLRALGILSSSAGGEMLNKPIQEYGTQAGELQQGLVDRLGKVEDWWMQRQQDFTKMKTDLETQYAGLKENISRDLRFNDRQRLTAVKAAQSALSQRLQDIQNQAMQYQTAAKQYSDNLLLQVAQLKMYQNPTADTSAILQTLLSSAQGGQQPQQVGVQQGLDPTKKLLSGLG